jgi:hypothetical protein
MPSIKFEYFGSTINASYNPYSMSKGLFDKLTNPPVDAQGEPIDVPYDEQLENAISALAGMRLEWDYKNSDGELIGTNKQALRDDAPMDLLFQTLNEVFADLGKSQEKEPQTSPSGSKLAESTEALPVTRKSRKSRLS